VEGKDYFTNQKVVSNPPGPITNDQIEKWLTSQDGLADSDGERYFLINKNLFYFFHMVYGGGPMLVNNSMYKMHEMH